MKKFGPEWTMFYVAHKAQGNSVEDSESWADYNLQDLICLRIPVDSIWIRNDQDLAKRLIRIKVLRQDADCGIEVQRDSDHYRWFEPVSVLLDESLWIRVAK